MDTEKIFGYIDSMRDEMINTLGELISHPSFRQEPEEGAPYGRDARECLGSALKICEKFGFKTENVGDRAGLASFTEGEPLLGILAHLDVVPAGDGWVREPYKATVEGGKIYGRGAMDDKGPAVSVMYAMKALKDLGVPLKHGFELILGTDEECGSSDIKYFREHRRMPRWLFTPDANFPLINIEKGRIESRFTAPCRSNKLISLHGGKTVNAVPAFAYAEVEGIPEAEIINAAAGSGCTAEFGISSEGGRTKIEVRGVSAHASTPAAGDNALTALIKLLSLIDLDEPAKGLLSGLAREFPYKETDGRSAGVAARDGISGELTLVLSVLDFDGENLGGAIDIRFPVCETAASVCNKLDAALKRAGFEASSGGSEPHCVPSDSPFVKTLLGAYESVTGKKGECIAIGGGTYVHGIPGGVAFGCEVDGEDNRIHGADEFIRIDALVENAKIFAAAIAEVCNSDSL